MPNFLTVERGPRPGLQLVFGDSGRFKVGRSPSVDVPLPAEDRKIALLHAEIHVAHGVVSIKPFVEAGATRVNGRQISAETCLNDGDSLQFGETLLRFALGEASDSAPSSDRLSISEIVEGARTRRLESIDRTEVAEQAAPPSATGGTAQVVVSGAIFVEAETEILTCTDCGRKGIAPPRPDLWDAAWICRACAQAKRVSSPQIPSRIGNYDVIRPLARGGMGVVYEGIARDTGLHVAIKVLGAGREASEKSLERFIREQHITKTLRHPNIVCCYEAGTWDRSPYIVSEFVPGGDALSMASPTSSIQDVLWVGADLFRALGYGHDLGVVHRDVKPANLLLARAGRNATLRAKLADFGLAKSFADLGGKPLTTCDESGGSLLTIGPEQLVNFANMPSHGDLYAGAATVFWLLTGDSPLVLPVPSEKASFEQKTLAILDSKRKPLLDLRPDVPDAVADLIDGLVAHDPKTRAGMHAREVAVALNAIASRLAKRPAAKPATVTRVVDAAGSRRNEPVLVEEAGAVEERMMRSAITPEEQFKEAMDALERCIRMLEHAVDRAAVEVREAADCGDERRISRLVTGHEQAQSDLEATLSRWEKILWG